MNVKIQNNLKYDSAKWVLVLFLLVSAFFANSYLTQLPFTIRLISWTVLGFVVCAIALFTNKGRQFLTFAHEARVELRLVTWPSRQETMRTTLLVVAMVLLFSLALWGVDAFLLWAVGLLTGQRG